MKIRDLIAEESMKDYFNRLAKEHGIKALGSGAFGRVFQHPMYKNVVTKVYKASDRDYARYVKWAMAHQSNPWVPKIIEQVKYESKDGNMNILFMQKMKSFRDASEAAHSMMRMVKKVNPDMDKGDYDHLLEIIYDGVESGDFEAWKDFVFESEIMDDKHFAQLWGGFIRPNQARFDIHDGNMMYRPEDGQVVITDPVAGFPTEWVSDM